MLRGKTLKGKNRIHNGGKFWQVVRTEFDVRSSKSKTLLQSMKDGKQMFWADTINDQHVERIA